VTLEGRLARLVPLALAHADELYAATHGEGREELWRYVFVGPFADVEAFRADVEARARAEDALCFTVVEKASGRALGWQSYLNIEPAHGGIEVGSILYAPALQRTAAASEAQYLFARHAFETLGYRRYVWKCDNANEKSKAAAIRLGFVFEGLFRRHMIVKGRNRDTAWFSILDEEWPARRTAFETFLDPANFDSEGRQKLSLSALNAQSCAADREKGDGARAGGTIASRLG
jgi:RimJ/RimL family protein N-acetyltransferase